MHPVIHLLVDGNNLAVQHRTGSTGRLDNGVAYGFYQSIIALASQWKPTTIRVLWDHGSWRYEYFPGYKGARKKAREDRPQDAEQDYYQFLTQLGVIQEGLRHFGVEQEQAKGFEADDLAYHFSMRDPRKGKFILISQDRDWLQLINPEISVWRNLQRVLVTHETFSLEVEPFMSVDEFIWCKSVIGDKGDDIPGIVGVGEKTAIDVFRGTIKSGAKYDKIMHWLADKADGYNRSNKLFMLSRAPTPIEFLSTSPHEYSEDNLMNHINEMNFASLARERTSTVMSEFNARRIGYGAQETRRTAKSALLGSGYGESQAEDAS